MTMKTEPAVLFGSTSDAPTPVDTLGFKPYVESIARFLESSTTMPPLTISIEGEWGSGKSSFMLQLRDRLCATAENRVAVEFNAWRHDKDDSLWAAFALKCAQDLRSSLTFRDRIWGWVHLNRARLDGYKGWAHLTRLLVVTMLWLCLLLAGPTLLILKGKAWTEQTLMSLQAPPKAPQSTNPVGTQASPTARQPEPDSSHPISGLVLGLIIHGGVLGLWAACVIVGGSQLKKLGNPLESDLEKIVSTPGYEGKVEFIDQFHDDFKKILDAYVGQRRVYVFVDDLDRCDVPKAADLMRALNLMIDDDNRMIFIIGMDREKVAASIAAKYSSVLEYIDEGQDGPSPDKLAFGYRFLEKFIQIQYRLPQPRLINVRTLVGVTRGSFTRPTDDAEGLDPNIVDTETTKSDPISIERRAVEVLLDRDGDAVFTATEMVAPVFNFNPRRIKQFLNLFRLSVYIANGLGLFDEIQDRPVMTFEQLAKFIAISMTWPAFVQLLETDKSLLRTLHAQWLTAKPEAEEGWLKVSRFRYLIGYGCRASDGSLAPDAGDFSLELLDTEPLLAVTAPIVRVKKDPQNSPLSDQTMAKINAAGEAAAVAEPNIPTTQSSSGREQVPVEARLDELAKSYEVTRDTMKPGNERTAAMSALVRRARNLAKQVQDLALPQRLFSESGPGHRVIALGLAQALTPTSVYLPIVLDGIARAQSAFEQYQALNLATRILGGMTEDQKLELRSALLQQEGVPIDQSDSSRWSLREKLLAEIGPR
jgi:KAP family P-loop domain